MNLFDIFKSTQEKNAEEAKKHFTKSVQYEKEGNYKLAADSCWNAINFDRYNSTYWNNLAWDLYLLDDPTTFLFATDSATIACYLSFFNDFNCWDTKAALLAKQGYTYIALDCWKKACQLMKVSNKVNQNILKRFKDFLSGVFISYDFNSIGKNLADGIKEFNQNIDDPFIINTADKFTLDTIDNKIQKKINHSFYLIAIMTKRDLLSNNKYGVSNWIISEIAMANAQNKICIIMIEEGIDPEEIKCVIKSSQYLPFTISNFTSSIAQVIRMLREERKKILNSTIN